MVICRKAYGWLERAIAGGEFYVPAAGQVLNFEKNDSNNNEGAGNERIPETIVPG